MVDEEKISPEERLLKAVEQGPGSHEPAPEGAEKKQAAQQSSQTTTAAADHEVHGPAKTVPWKVLWHQLELKLRELQERKILPPISFSVKEWSLDLRFINRILTVGAVLVGIIILADLIFFQPKLEFHVQGLSSSAVPEILPDKESSKPLENYTSLTESRNLFQPYIPKPVVTQAEKQKAAEIQAIVDEAQGTGPPNLKLVAVASTDSGFEAIIEDQEKKESYFVKEKDKFGGYEVDSVSWNKVVLTRGSDRWELQ